MVTLQADPTQAGLNAYCTRAEANEYLLEKRLHALAGWEAVDNKDAAIIWATRELDRLNWAGTRAVASNRHEWPRAGLDGVENDAIPDQVKEACAELAYWLAQADRTTPSQQETFDSLTVGPIKLAYREAPGGPELTSEMPDSIRGMVARYLGGFSTSGINRLAVRV